MSYLTFSVLYLKKKPIQITLQFLDDDFNITKTSVYCFDFNIPIELIKPLDGVIEDFQDKAEPFNIVFRNLLSELDSINKSELQLVIWSRPSALLGGLRTALRKHYKHNISEYYESQKLLAKFEEEVLVEFNKIHQLSNHMALLLNIPYQNRSSLSVNDSLKHLGAISKPDELPISTLTRALSSELNTSRPIIKYERGLPIDKPYCIKSGVNLTKEEENLLRTLVDDSLRKISNSKINEHLRNRFKKYNLHSKNILKQFSKNNYNIVEVSIMRFYRDKNNKRCLINAKNKKQYNFCRAIRVLLFFPELKMNIVLEFPSLELVTLYPNGKNQERNREKSVHRLEFQEDLSILEFIKKNPKLQNILKDK